MSDKRAQPVLQDVKILQELESEMVGHIIKVSQTYSIPKEKTHLSLQKIHDSVQILVGNRIKGETKHFQDEDLGRLYSLINQLGKDRHYLIFIRDEDGRGATELLTKLQFKFKENE